MTINPCGNNKKTYPAGTLLYSNVSNRPFSRRSVFAFVINNNDEYIVFNIADRKILSGIFSTHYISSQVNIQKV